MKLKTTHKAATLARVAKIVVFSDLCNSTMVLEDLLQSESHNRWRRLLIRLKNFLAEATQSNHFHIYKFIGDGWVLLFDPSTPPESLFRFLRTFAKEYAKAYKEIIEPVLSTQIYGMGMTFGMDRGTLVRLVMNGREEFIGRPLNVAARLQSVVKDRDYAPQNKVLVTSSLFADMKPKLGAGFRTFEVTRKLRNIASGKNFRCHKVELFRRT